MSALSFFSNRENSLFAVQYVGEVSVEGSELNATFIDTYIMSAKSIQEARELAENHKHIGSDKYHNQLDGKLVVWKSLGIHSIEEISFVYNEQILHVDRFLFSKLTKPQNLIDQVWPRKDLPPIDG